MLPSGGLRVCVRTWVLLRQSTREFPPAPTWVTHEAPSVHGSRPALASCASAVLPRGVPRGCGRWALTAARGLNGARSQGDKYVDKTLYSNQQKEKKKGFGTGDFRRRDEFSNIIRTEQYRQQLNVRTPSAARAKLVCARTQRAWRVHAQAGERSRQHSFC